MPLMVSDVMTPFYCLSTRLGPEKHRDTDNLEITSLEREVEKLSQKLLVLCEYIHTTLLWFDHQMNV